MRILIATDAWHPQVNGVVQTLNALAGAALPLGAAITFLTPDQFATVALPAYREIRLAIPDPRAVTARMREASIDAVHIATEGPIGLMARAICRRNAIPFTTSFHTRFPDYIAARLPIPQRWAKIWTWAWLRRFHAPASTVMAATPSLARELAGRGFRNVGLWPRGVDTARFRPHHGIDLGLPRPIFLTVGRLAVEKNLAAFLGLDLPGSKVVVGDGPAHAELKQRHPDVTFLGARRGEALAAVYAAADVFVFPSRTDTFGLVMLEALASGVPVAAFPVPGPQDVIGDAPIGALDEDLRVACLRALTIPRAACRAHACRMTWTESARCFLQHIHIAGRPARNASAQDRGLRAEGLSKTHA
ncbi:MAG: glycosyltransferase [Rhizobiales bacterium]|nr:glycosyltransferase [Hyphomicrobiales bacterium]